VNLLLPPYSEADVAQNPRLEDAFQLVVRGDIAAATASLVEQANCGLPGSAFLLAALYYQTGKCEDAIAVIERAPELNTHSLAWTIKGVCDIRLGKSSEGFVALRHALTCDWQNRQAHRYTWTALEMLGRLSRSVAQARDAIATNHRYVSIGSGTQMIDLSSVTICAVDCVHPALAARALQLSGNECRFGKVKLLTSANYHEQGIETVKIPNLNSGKAYSEFVIKELHRYIDTDYALVAQWDGYVINGHLWTEDFFKYDYIGARWTPEILGQLGPGKHFDVGNGGFSLRSKRFLQAAATVAKHRGDNNLHPEDAVLCQTMRPELESKFGIVFAPSDVADQFAFEHVITEQKTFGFHGVINLAMAINAPSYSRFEFLDNQQLNQSFPSTSS
jgi:tetratricopeptide (TPR) repeat protein